MSSDENIHWLQSQSEERARRHRLGWGLMLALGVVIGLGAILASRLVPPAAQTTIAGGQSSSIVTLEPPVVSLEPKAQPSQDRPALEEPPARPDATAETGAITATGSEPPRTDPHREPNAEGWWIILASFPEAAGVPDAAGRTVVEAARRCGVAPLAEASNRFEGLSPQLMVFLVGPYTERGNAQQNLRRIRTCVPDAYFKWAKRRPAALRNDG